jgi:hypothetical protein
MCRRYGIGTLAIAVFSQFSSTPLKPVGPKEKCGRQNPTAERRVVDGRLIAAQQCMRVAKHVAPIVLGLRVSF